MVDLGRWSFKSISSRATEEELFLIFLREGTILLHGFRIVTEKVFSVVKRRNHANWSQNQDSKTTNASEVKSSS
jgi:hypothetical protein